MSDSTSTRSDGRELTARDRRSIHKNTDRERTSNGADARDSIVESAIEFWRAGMAPVALRASGETKRPVSKNWPEITFEDEGAVRRAFARGNNLGIRLGDGIVDVDLDSEAAVAAGPYLLPATPVRSGKPSTPEAHYWYRVKGGGDLPLVQHHGAAVGSARKGPMLVELRADGGHQTMVPPSIHPDEGAALRWVGDARPWDAPEVDGGTLAAAVAAVAVVAALAPFWPGEGGRHYAYLALAGALLRSAHDDARYVAKVEEIVSTLATILDDEEADERVAQSVPTTLRRFVDGGEATGWTALQEYLDADRPERVTEAARKAAAALREAMGVPPEGGDPASVFDGSGDWQDLGERSHMRIASRFVVFAAGRCRYFHGVGWHFWDGRRWARDHGDAYAHGVLRDLIKVCAVEALRDDKLRSDLAAASSRPENTLKDAARRPEILATEADRDPYLLNCWNGTLDLHTGKLRPADPADLITKVTRASYDPSAPREAWDRFLADVLPDEEVRDYLRRYVGVSLVGLPLEHVLMIAVGPGRNGKGVFAHAVQRALGDYAVTATNDLLTTGRYGGKSAGDLSAQMQLRGARWAAMSELNVDDRLAPATMKTLTGGDPITAKLMGKDFVTFEPSHSLFMLTNYLPRVPAEDRAAWARIRVVPFEVSFEGREDKHLDERLALSMDAVLTWAIEGLADYRRRGERLDEPEVVQRARDGYRDHNDLVKRFLQENCVMDEGRWVARTELLSAFNSWLLDLGERRWTSAALTERLLDLPEVQEAKRRGTRGWKGVDLLVDL